MKVFLNSDSVALWNRDSVHQAIGHRRDLLPRLWTAWGCMVDLVLPSRRRIHDHGKKIARFDLQTGSNETSGFCEGIDWRRSVGNVSGG